MSPFVLVLMYVMAPVAWPTAKLLDVLLGEDHGTTYKKAGLKTLVSLHHTIGDAGEQLNSDEVTIISAVLDLKEKSVGNIMTPMADVFTLSGDDVLDDDTMDRILSQGYSRIPIHAPDSKENYIGMLLVKMLITYDPEDCQPVRDFALATLPETRPETSCLDIVNFFQEGKSHMVLVSERPGEDTGALGVVTLEDVIEELIGEEIIDESDVYVDVHKAIRRMAPAPRTRVPKGQVVADSGHAKQGENDGRLIDIDESEDLKAEDLSKETKERNVPPRTGVPAHSSSPRRPLAQLRRQSTGDTQSGGGAGGGFKPPRRSNTGELREQLKHLGPSNLASRPRTTRWTSVKIKPGTSADSQAPKLAPIAATPESRRADSSGYFPAVPNDGVVSSGGSEAKDGLRAFNQGYGATSLGSPLTSRVNGSAEDKDLHQPNIDATQNLSSGGHVDRQGGDAALSRQRSSRTRHASQSDGESTLGNLDDYERDHSRNRRYDNTRPARSGSITENVVDSKGVKKVVLELTSSSSNENDDENNEGADGANEEEKDEGGHHRSLTDMMFHRGENRDEAGKAKKGEGGQASKRKRGRKTRRKNGNTKAEQAKGQESEPLLGKSNNNSNT